MVYVLPIHPMRAIVNARSQYDEYNERCSSSSSSSIPAPRESVGGLPPYYDLWAQLAKLQAFENFQLVGLVEHGNLERGGHVTEMKPKYVSVV